MERLKVSVVIPVYNESWTIREIVRRVLAQSALLHEVILVDDGSTDGTRERLAEILDAHKKGPVRLRVILKERNEGKGAALADGFKACEGDIVIVQDADLEYDPQDYAALIQPILEGQADVVYGSRFLGQSRNVLLFWHSVANNILTLLCNLFTNLNMSDVWTGYKVFRADIIRKIPITSRGFNFEPEITIKLAKLGCRIYEVPVRYHGRSYAEGKKIGLKDAFIGLWTMIRTALWDDLGELAVGEQTLRVMAKAGRYNKLIYEQYRPHLGREIVEVGAGVGNISRFLLDRDKVVLTEFDPGFIELLKRRFEGWGYVDVQALDVTNPNGKADKLWDRFDTAVCFNVIEHVEDDKTAVANITKLLKPGGKAVLIVPAHQWLYGSLDKHLGHFKRYSKEDFEALLGTAGLEIVESRYMNPIAVPGWYLNGRVFRAKVISDFQLSMFEKLSFLVRWSMALRLPFGLSLFVVARRPS